MNRQYDFFEVQAMLVARFGSDVPARGVLHTTPCTLKDGALFIDTYGLGCIHDSELNPYRKSLKRAGLWNSPTPFPADLNVVFEYLNNGDYDRIIIGHKSEPFPWMDSKYEIAKTIMRLVSQLSTCPVQINTSSDLVGRDDYIDLFKPIRGRLTINMRTEFTRTTFTKSQILKSLGRDYWPSLKNIDQIMRVIEPGAPSLLRRDKACTRLIDSGFKVKHVSLKHYAKTKGA